MKNGIQLLAGCIGAALLTLAALLVAACGSSTDPGGGGEVEITYSPTVAAFTMTVGGSRELRTTVTGTDQAEIAWSADGAAVGSGPVYVHVPAQVGTDTVAVVVGAGGRTSGRQWLVTVEPDLSQLPPVVSGVTLTHGPRPGEVVVSWLRVTPTHAPIDDYLVACSYAGPVTGDQLGTGRRSWACSPTVRSRTRRPSTWPTAWSRARRSGSRSVPGTSGDNSRRSTRSTTIPSPTPGRSWSRSAMT